MAKQKKGGAFGEMLSEAPDSNVVPEGMYLCRIVKIVEKHSKTGKLMICPQFAIMEPKTMKGQTIFENYVLGSDEDPDANDPATFKSSIGARNYKTLLKKAGVPVAPNDDSEDIAQKAAGQEILLSVQQTEQAEGPYKGQIQNRISAYYEPGEREPKVTGEAPKAAKKVEKSTPKVEKKKAPAPEDEDEDEDGSDEDDEDDEDDD